LFPVCADIKFWLYRKRVGTETDNSAQLLYGWWTPVFLSCMYRLPSTSMN
jgi:hypothetical protein